MNIAPCLGLGRALSRMHDVSEREVERLLAIFTPKCLVFFTLMLFHIHIIQYLI